MGYQLQEAHPAYRLIEQEKEKESFRVFEKGRKSFQFELPLRLRGEFFYFYCLQLQNNDPPPPQQKIKTMIMIINEKPLQGSSGKSSKSKKGRSSVSSRSREGGSLPPTKFENVMLLEVRLPNTIYALINTEP